MKINWNKKYNTYAAYACGVGAVIIFFIFFGIYFEHVIGFFKQIMEVFAPILYGIAIAYVLNPVCKLFENRVFKGLKIRKLKRAISMVLAYAIFFTVIVLLVYAVFPELVRSFNDLQSSLIVYANSLQDWVDRISASSPQFGAILKTIVDTINLNALAASLSQLFESFSNILTALAPVISSYVEVFMVQLKNILLGLIFSAYFLASKELVTAQVRKLGHALISDRKYEKMSYFIRFTDHTFGRYLIGTLLDSILVAGEFFLVLTIFRFPYAPLVSIVCGFTNMIPIFGPFIGAIPSFLIIFIANPVKALWFVLIVLLIQQIDGNIIAPRIIGESTGLSAIAVISAVTIMGGLFGILGMVIGVPLCAVFANIINDKTDERIREKEAARMSKSDAHSGGSSSSSTEAGTGGDVHETTDRSDTAADTVSDTVSDSGDCSEEGRYECTVEESIASAKDGSEDESSCEENAEAEKNLSPVEKMRNDLSRILRNCMSIRGRRGGKKK